MRRSRFSFARLKGATGSCFSERLLLVERNERVFDFADFPPKKRKEREREVLPGRASDIYPDGIFMPKLTTEK